MQRAWLQQAWSVLGTLVAMAAPDHGHLEGSEQSVCLACSAPTKAVPCEGERGDCLQCYREHGQARHRLLCCSICLTAPPLEIDIM